MRAPHGHPPHPETSVPAPPPPRWEPGTHRKSGHSLGPVPRAAEAGRGQAEGTGRHGGGRGLEGTATQSGRHGGRGTRGGWRIGTREDSEETGRTETRKPGARGSGREPTGTREEEEEEGKLWWHIIREEINNQSK